MYFMNNTNLIIGLFLFCLVIHYLRYRRMVRNNFHISGLLLIKYLIRSLILFCLLLVLKNILNVSVKVNQNAEKALFVISTDNHLNFKLTEDDQVNISSRIPTYKFKEIELCLYNTNTNSFYLYIPKTSKKTFLHLLKIERRNVSLSSLLKKTSIRIQRPINRVEMYQWQEKEWFKSDTPKDHFSILQLIDYENDLVSPYLIHYLLILIVILITFDLSFKYRILKI